MKTVYIVFETDPDRADKVRMVFQDKQAAWKWAAEQTKLNYPVRTYDVQEWEVNF